MTNGFKAATRVLLVGGLVTAVACGDLLEVENPNAIAEDSMTNPAAAPNMANGALAATVRALTAIRVPYAVATDELDWIGSRDSWSELEKGVLSNPINEFTDGAFPFLGEARYLVDKTIERLEGFNTSGLLSDRSHLARTYLYAAIVYASIADMYDDFAFSDKTTPANPVGRANMGTALYDKAITYLNTANTLATAAGANANLVALRYPIMAYRARVKHGRAVWAKLTPKSTTPPANPLVTDNGFMADASAALALATTPDQKFEINSNVEARAGINIWNEVNGRQEHRTGIYYRNLDDPMTPGVDDPTAQAQLARFTAFGQNAGVFTLTSNRELRLMLAEGYLAQGAAGVANFRTELNAVRALDGKPAYLGVGPTDQAMLEHERAVQLWLMGRRLSDMQRFNIEDVGKWVDISGFESVKSFHGLFFPIPYVEILANPCVTTPCSP